MPLFRDLPQDKQEVIIADLARREAAVREIFMDAGRRATIFLFLLLIGGVTASVTILMRSGSQPLLGIASLICFFMGLLLLMFVFMLNHEMLWRISFQFSAYKSGLLKSEIDTETLNATVKPTWKMRVPTACMYASTGLWVTGAVLCLVALAHGSDNTRRESVAFPNNAHVTESQAPQSQVQTNAAPAASPATAEPARTATSKAIIFADKIAIGAVMVGLLQVVAVLLTFGVMRTSARRQLRAYVFAEGFDLIDGSLAHPPQPQRAGFPGAVLTIKNSGATPAYNVRSGALIDIMEPINEDKLVLSPLMNKFGASLGPGVGLTNTPWFARALTPSEVADIAIGAKAIYLHGRVEYEDAFGKKHFTEFRLRYVGNFPPSAKMPLVFAAQGNTAD
jgi:hypothetical protein